MATLRYNNIYVNLSASMAYVVEKSKIVPQADIIRVQTYVKGDHSESPLYTVTYNCSSNIELAAEEFEMDRQLYWLKRKSTKLPGQTQAKKEVYAHHFYISFRHDEWITSEEILKILDEFIKQNHLDDYRIIAAVHRNTRSPHVHFLVSATAMSCDKKLGMNNTKLKALKKSLNHITYEHGYGFIDNKSLSYDDAEYAAWVSSVKAAGKVPVYCNLTVQEKIEAETRRAEKRKNPKAEKTTTEAIKDAYEYNQRKNWDVWKDQESDYYYDSSLLPAFKGQKQQYRMKLWDENTGRRRGTLELFFMLLGVLLFSQQQKEAALIKPMYSRKDINWELQRMIDGIAAVRELGIMDEKQLQEQVSECGANISSIRRHIYYVKKALEQENNSELLAEQKRYEALLKIHRIRYAKLMAIKAVLKDCYRPEYIYSICPEENLMAGAKGVDSKEEFVESEFVQGVFEESAELRQDLER